VMVPELVKLMESLEMPSPLGFDIVMVPELVRVAPDTLWMPSPGPVFDIVMVPVAELLMLPVSLTMPTPPVFDIVMVPELEMVSPSWLKMPVPPEF